MSAYKLSRNGLPIRQQDGIWIPNDPSNTDRQMYKVWIDNGNTPDPADPSPEQAVQAPNSEQPKFQKVKEKVNVSALPAGTKTALLDILGTLVDNL